MKITSNYTDDILIKRSVPPRSLNAMYIDLLGQVARDYTLVGGMVEKNNYPNVFAHMENLMRASATSDMDIVHPDFEVTNNFTIVPRVDASFLAPASREVDRYLFGDESFTNYLWHSSADNLDYVPVVAGLPRVIPSLVEIVSKTLSWSHYACGQRYGYSSWVSTDEYCDHHDILENFQTFSFDNSFRDARFIKVTSYLTKALGIMFDFFYDRSNFKTIKFDYNPISIIRELKIDASAGIKNGPNMNFSVGCDKIVVTSKGKKFEQLPDALNRHREHVKKLRAGLPSHVTSYCIIKLKIDRKCAYAGTLPTLMKIRRKKREFFMTSTEQQIDSTWVNGPRIKIERGNTMNIGRSWWYGGAYDFACYLNYDIPNMRWYEGDYEKHDRHIQDWLLMVYQATNFLYYDVEKMTESVYRFFVAANKEVLANLIIKITCHTGGVWRILRGFLYSGGKETSSAGSFCTVLCFCLYIVHTLELYPGRARVIKRALRKLLIRIAAYGDDHLWCAPGVLEDVLNEDLFAIFSAEFFDMRINERVSHDTFITSFDSKGNLLYEGPKFLKTHFIRGVILPILPFKSTNNILERLLAPSSNLPIDTMLRSVGQAWDTKFTNYTAYHCCEIVFKNMIKIEKRSFD